MTAAGFNGHFHSFRTVVVDVVTRIQLLNLTIYCCATRSEREREIFHHFSSRLTALRLFLL